MRIYHIVTLLLASSTTLFPFNHPEIKWKSVTTKHFIINYYDKTEPAVYAAWKISEEAYEVLSKLYNYTPREKIALSIADYDDYSNGYAEWTSASIMIWLPDSRFDLRSNTTWLRNVITHELAHIISLENKKKRQMIDVSIGLSLTTPDENFGILEPFPRITTYPTWMAEGIAQFETESLGNDCFDSRREMLLRCAVISNTQLSLAEMGSFNHDRIGSELVYNQGFAFTRYIAGKIGLQKLHKLFKIGATESTGFFRLFSEVTGYTLPELYNTWIDSLKTDYPSRFSSISDTFITRCSRGRFNLRPEISPDGSWWSWLSSGTDDGGRTDLLVAPYGSARPAMRVPYAHTAHCFSPSSNRVYYLKSRTPDRNGSYYNDIYYRDIPRGREQRLTRGGRVYDITPIPGSKNLLCVSYRNGAFGLFTCNSTTGFLTLILPGESGNPIVNISVNPNDPASVVLSKIIDGQSRLFRMSLTTRNLEALSTGGAQEESPAWATNGRIYFSADYDGVFNIYSLLPDGTDLQRHTTTDGGYFSPKRTPAGTIAASHYGASGFATVIVPSAGKTYPVPEGSRCRFKPLPVPKGKVSIKDRSYSASYRRGVSELFLGAQLMRNSSLLTGQYETVYDTSDLVITGGISKYQSDALHKKDRLFQLQLGAQATFGEEHSSGYYNRFASPPHSAKNSPFLQKAIDQRPVSETARRYSLLNEAPALTIPRRALTQQSEPVGSDSVQEEQNLLFAAIPVFAIENRAAAPTLGLEMSSYLASMVAPALISVTPYTEYQFAREWTAGLRLELTSMPFHGLPLFGNMPFFLQWFHPGVYNEDITYNYADVAQLEISVGPRFQPGMYLGKVISYDDLYDTSVVGGVEAQINFFYGIPLFKYSSLQLFSFTTGVYHSRRTLDDMVVQSSNGVEFLPGFSNSYVASFNGLRAVFPLARTINRGHRYYFDALYGYIGYQLFSYTNSSFFDHLGAIGPEVLTDPDFRPESIMLEHTVSIGCNLGHYLSYLFFRQLSVDFTYYILNNYFYLSLTSGF
ncbi:MAG: hypothetical protein JW863_08465 [Chitinispirillaceae bacterium]|nr:hypothetical protein [Chitinispirillaceae bacterium]